jgi:hypothetical protein
MDFRSPTSRINGYLTHLAFDKTSCEPQTDMDALCFQRLGLAFGSHGAVDGVAGPLEAEGHLPAHSFEPRIRQIKPMEALKDAPPSVAPVTMATRSVIAVGVGWLGTEHSSERVRTGRVAHMQAPTSQAYSRSHSCSPSYRTCRRSAARQEWATLNRLARSDDKRSDGRDTLRPLPLAHSVRPLYS